MEEGTMTDSRTGPGQPIVDAVSVALCDSIMLTKDKKFVRYDYELFVAALANRGFKVVPHEKQ